MFAQLLGFSFGLGPAFRVGRPQASVPRQDGVNGAAASGALAHSGQGEGGVRMRGEPAAAEAGMTLQQPEARRAFPPGKLSPDHRTLAVAGCTGSREGRCGE